MESKPNANKGTTPTRVVNLAEALFVKLFLAERGTKIPAKLAQDSIAAAREFYKVADQNEV